MPPDTRCSGPGFRPRPEDPKFKGVWPDSP
jgi:hypothetical protein